MSEYYYKIPKPLETLNLGNSLKVNTSINLAGLPLNQKIEVSTFETLATRAE